MKSVRQFFALALLICFEIAAGVLLLIDPEKVARVIFEYSKNATLYLNYENQEYLVSTGKYNPKTRDYDYKRLRCDMIIFEELIPMDEAMKNVPAYMVPESSLNQGFIEEDG